MATENKRSHPRINSLNLLSYFVYDQKNVLVQQGMGRTLNVSQSGIRLETHIPVDPEHVMALSIGFEDQLVDLRGKAVFSKEGEKNMFETGIEFFEIDAVQQAFLTKFIEAFEAQKD